MARSRFIAIFSPAPERLFEAAPLLSPRAEVYPPDGLILEVPPRYEAETLERIARALPERDWRLGGASTRTAAVVAARLDPGTLIAAGKEADYLAAQPIEVLAMHRECDAALLETLAQWGVRTLGEFAALPEAELVARWGARALSLLRMARGEESLEFLTAYQPPPEFRVTRELEWEIDNLEPLGFLLGGMLEELCDRMKRRGLAMEALTVRLQLVDGGIQERALRLALPMREPKAILSLLRLELQGKPPTAAIRSVALEAAASRPRVFQHSLLHPTAPSPEKLSRTLTRLKSLVGEAGVGVPQRLDSHRPDAFFLRELELDAPLDDRVRPAALSRRIEVPRRLAIVQEEQSMTCHSTPLSLRRVRPPEPISLRTDRILSCAGPWRSSGEWWCDEASPEGWSREEWDVELVDGGIYRVYWDSARREWFLEGVYD